jgi:hypothetical protein
MLLVVCFAQPDEPPAPVHTAAAPRRTNPARSVPRPPQREVRIELHAANTPTVLPAIPVRPEPLPTMPSSRRPALQVDAAPRAPLPALPDATASAAEPDPYAN